MRHLLIALQFLTILPVPSPKRCEADDLGRSTAWFPLAGLIIGSLLWLADQALTVIFPRHLTDALLVALLALLTGALHLDGLADVCDGLAARGDKQHFLAVMKDSRVGAVGVVGVVVGLLLKYAALLAVPIYLKGPALLLFPALARFGQVTLLTGSRSARSDGLGTLVLSGMQPLQFFLAAACILPMAWFGLRIAGLVALSAVFSWALLVRSWFTRRLNGITGDIVGFASEAAEIIALLCVTATTILMMR
ncbi:MAG: adenosylcobinamide-GDP ribazoletransferase [Trichlorobacter sp.]|jgi:adenosylcobinamide-GDP ribazoletransferase